jgi:dTDP-4-dehydrorhamnose 3,5-epimerase
VILNYLVDNYYDGSDELGVAWDDPQIALPWDLPRPPILSPRDGGNSKLSEIPEGDLPT